MSSPSFLTQAGNFAGAMAGGADPRTGEFNELLQIGHRSGDAAEVSTTVIAFGPAGRLDVNDRPTLTLPRHS